MKRDMELIRKILFQLETDERCRVVVDGYDDQTIAYHERMLIEAGFLSGKATNTSAGVHTSISHITWLGHDFIDAARDPDRWDQAKEIVKDKGGSVTFDVLKQLLTSIMKKTMGLG